MKIEQKNWWNIKNLCAEIQGVGFLAIIGCFKINQVSMGYCFFSGKKQQKVAKKMAKNGEYKNEN